MKIHINFHIIYLNHFLFIIYTYHLNEKYNYFYNKIALIYVFAQNISKKH